MKITFEIDTDHIFNREIESIIDLLNSLLPQKPKYPKPSLDFFEALDREEKQKVDQASDSLAHATPAMEKDAPTKKEKAAPVKTETPEITVESLREQTAEKAKAGHRDTLVAKLAELGAKSVSNLAPENYSTYQDFLNTLK